MNYFWVYTIFLVISAVMIIRGIYLIYCGIRYEDIYGDFLRGVQRCSFAIFLGMVLWGIDFLWDGEWFEYIKTFAAKNAVALKIMVGILFLIIGPPLIGIIVALIKFFLVGTSIMKKCFNEEYEYFLDKMDYAASFGSYIDKFNYEGEYSNSEIEKYQKKFAKKVKKWLHKNKPGCYLVTIDDSVLVLSIIKAEENRISNYERYIVH